MEIVTVEMVETTNGSPDGCRVQCYEEGGVYDLPFDLANAFICMEVAKAEEPIKELEVELEIKPNPKKVNG